MRSETIGHFEILGKIGEGGMGVVYRARDTQLKRTVAIKVLSALYGGDPTSQRRFVQEARSASALNHPNIITVHDAASANRTYFIVMEHVQGKPLSELIPRGGMDLQRALKIGIQVADALCCAHAVGIVHRDIKPSNIMVRDDGVVKVLDFGLAKLVEAPEVAEFDATRADQLTQEGAVLGTPGFMSPEQVEGRKADARSDIFSFAVVLFVLLTGRSTFHGDSPAAAMAAILRDDPEWPELPAPQVPEKLRALIDRCLHKNPERRVQSIQEVKSRLEELHESSTAQGANAKPAIVDRRNRAFAIVAAIILVAAIAGFAASRLSRREPAQVALKLRPLTDDEGTTRFPAISRDGKLIAYSSNRAGNAGLDIWVQQIAPGARPIRLTYDPADEISPTFSPDGSQIAFSSLKDGGSLYVIPALGGEQRLVAQGSGVASPRFSPDGQWLAAAPNGMVYPVSGGPARRLVDTAGLLWSPVWSPDGKHLLFAGDIGESSADWSIVPSEGGTSVKLGFQRIASTLAGPREWIGDSVLFSDGDIKRVRVASDPWRLSGPAESLTTSPGVEMEPRAIPHPTRPGSLMIVFVNGVQRSLLWEIPIDHNQGKVAPGGGRRLSEDYSDRHTPSLSSDGNRLTYVRRGNQGFEIHARDLPTGADRILARVENLPRARISPDGSTVAVNPQGTLEDEKVVELIPWSGGARQVLCDSCGLIYDWSPDGKRILYRSGKPVRFSDISVETRQPRVVAGDLPHSLGAAVLSHDQHWFAIQYAVTENIRPIYIAPARGGVAAARDEWIALGDGLAGQVRPWWSPDGGLLYFISDADGKARIWAQRLAPADRKAMGEPLLVYSPPDERFTLSAGAAFGPALGAETPDLSDNRNKHQYLAGRVIGAPRFPAERQLPRSSGRRPRIDPFTPRRAR
jgi:Tol biopolymer transport system component